MARRGRKDLDKSGNAYFITTTVMNFLNIFSLGDQYYDVVISSLKYLLNEHNGSLIAYVLMPNHIHLILSLPEGESVSDFMRDLKRHTSVKVREFLINENKNSLIEKLT